MESGEPASMESGEAVNMESTEPATMESQKPVVMESGEPANMESGEPVNMESGEAMNMESGEPVVMEVQEHVLMESEEPDVMVSVETVNIESVEHLVEPIDTEFGDIIDTEFREPIDTEFPEPDHEQYGEPLNMESGELVELGAGEEPVREAVETEVGGLVDVPVNDCQAVVSHVDSSGGDAQEVLSAAAPLSIQVDTTEFFKTDQEFGGREEVLDWAKKTGREHGVVVTVRRSDVSDPKRTPRIVLACERSCSYRSKRKSTTPDTKGRSPITKKCDCPFSLKISLLNKSEGTWGLEVINGIHNHPLDVKVDGHSFMGRLDKDEEEILLGMSKSGVRPREILTQLKARDPTNASTMRTIYNARAKLRNTQTSGHTHLQQLLKLLVENGYVERHRSDPSTGRVQDIFWAHPMSIQLAQTFPFVFMIDCTSKMNRFCLPLLEIVGVTSTDKTFTVAFFYMKSENEDNYVWALECFKSLLHNAPRVIVTDLDPEFMKAVKQAFPDTRNLICHAYIGKDVLDNSMKSFANEEDCNKFLLSWTDVMRSSSEEEYKEKLYELQNKFCDYQMALTYIHDTLLFKYKTQFVSAWIDQYFHLGNTSTKRAESCHAKLKLYLQSSLQELVNAFKSIHLLLELQITEIKLSFEDSLTQIPHRFRDPFYKNLVGVVSTAALEKIEIEASAADYMGIGMIDSGAAPVDSLGIIPETCCHKALHTLGLPCAHMIVQYRNEGRAIPLSDVHSFWKTLAIKTSAQEKTSEITIKGEVDSLYKAFLSSTRPQKLEMKKQLQRIVKPSGPSPTLAELRRLTTEAQSKQTGKKRGRGRPRKHG